MISSSLLLSRPPSSLCAAIAGYASVILSPQQLPVLRRQPGPSRAPISPSLLRHADPQTVAGLAAVLQAIEQHRLRDMCFRDWGVIAGPALLGRQASGEAIDRFIAEGAFAISPHLIPHESLHAVSGTVSQVLELHGPNFGAGGGPWAAEEALLAAATLLSGTNLPGLWVVLTEFDREVTPLEAGAAAARPLMWLCHAVALALAPAEAVDGLGLQVTITGPEGTETAPLLRVAALGAALDSLAARPRWRLRNGGGVRLEGAGAGTEKFCE